jgi:hypothetical protein
MLSEQQIKGIQAGVLLPRERLFMNSPDIAHTVVASNTGTPNYVTMTLAPLAGRVAIIGVIFGNTSENTVAIYDLENAKYGLKKPMLVTAKADDQKEWLVAFPEAELSRSGDSLDEALSWFKSSVVELYELFKEQSQLGPLPKKQLEVLGQYLVAKPNPKT